MVSHISRLPGARLAVEVRPARASGLPRAVMSDADFARTVTDGDLRTRPVPIGRSGAATVVLTLRDTAGRLLVRDSLVLPARDSVARGARARPGSDPRARALWRWRVTVQLTRAEAADDPSLWCRGCDGQRRVPLRGPSPLPGFPLLDVTWTADDPGMLPKPPA